MTKRLLAFIFSLIMVVGLLPPIHTQAAATYDVDKAIAYAKANWDSGVGLCAEFVSRCVRAGGLNISVEAGTGGCWRAIQKASGLTKQPLKLNSSGYATKALNGDILAKGDVVVQWCSTHNIAPHIMICGGYDSSGYATYYAHNGALNNKRYKLGLNTAYNHTKDCDMGGQVIRISTLNVDSVTFNPVVTPSSYSVRFSGTVSYTKTRPSEFGILMGTSPDNLHNILTETMGGTANPYEVVWANNTLEHNTTYYYQYYAIINGKTFKDSVRSFTTPADNKVISVESSRECGYMITISANQELICYNNVTSKSEFTKFEASDTEYTIFCKDRYVMSDKTVRYSYDDWAGIDLYFRFISDTMKSELVHNYSTKKIAPTCNTQGYTVYSCTCGDSFTDDFVAPAHAWTVWNVTVKPTADTPGIKERTCKSCNEMQQEILPAGTVIINFKDVKPSAYYYDSVQWAVESGITTGTSATTFSPGNTCTRAQVVTFLWRAMGSPAPKSQTMPFKDVAKGSYYYDAVLWAVENGITTGTSATKFSPGKNVTRAQTVTFLWRTAGSPAIGSANPFKDVSPKHYFYDAVLWAVGQNITNGINANTFGSNDPCQRCQIVTFLWRFLK